MPNLQAQIEELEAKIAATSNKYKAKSLKDKLGWIKAEAKGQFITADHLTEYKGYIISTIKRVAYFKSQANTIAACKAVYTELDTNVVYRSKRGIKGVIGRMAASAAKSVDVDIVIANQGGDAQLALDSYRNPEYAAMQQYHLASH